MGLLSKKKKPPVAMLGGDGGHGFDIVGESHYVSALMSLIAKAPANQRANGEVFDAALQVKDTKNPFDARAIAVLIDGPLVGHIGRVDCDAIHDAISAVAAQGYSDNGVGCLAVIGWDARNPSPLIDVCLDLERSRDDVGEIRKLSRLPVRT
jgi:hypothetical protein